VIQQKGHMHVTIPECLLRSPTIEASLSFARDPSGYDPSLQWAASPGAIAYHVYWRDAVKRLGTRSDCRQYNSFRVHDASIDDFVFGVAAVGSDGHQSLISAYVASDRLFRYIWAAENFADCPGLSVSFRW